MSGWEPTAALVVCDGAAVPADLAARDWDVEAALTSGDRLDGLNLRVDGLAGKVLGSIDARAADLVRIAAYCYGADQLVARRRRSDVHRAGWRRRMVLCVPVSDPAFWSEPGTHAALAAALGYGTDDAWSFAFDRFGAGTLQLPLDLEDRPLLAWPDSVLLFSGGTDSLCALVEAVAAGARPVVVSHRPAPHVDHRQKLLLDALRRAFPAWQFPHLSFRVHRRGSEATDSTQRARGFLFAALGAAVAGQVGLPAVQLPDNGYVSFGPPINAQLVAALASRGTHPTFLRLVNDLVARVFPNGPRVANPLADRTRAEALRALAANRYADLLPETRSCGRQRGPERTNERPHCGGCSQCVDRRFATVAAGLEAHDPAATYGLDVFEDELPDGEPRTVAVSYVQFAQRVAHLDPDALFLEYPQLEGCLDPEAPGLVAAAGCLADLMQRHAGEVLWVVAEMVRRRGDALARGTLAELSLLRLTVGAPGVAIGVREAGATTDPEERPAEAPTHPVRPRHRFERHSRSWLVEFGEEKGLVDHSVGMERLARLLKAPGQSLEALDLVAWSGPSRDAPREDPEDEDGAVDPDALHVGGPGRLGSRTDRAGIEILRQQARLLEEDFAAAQAPEDEDERVRIRAKIEELADRMAADVDHRGKPRPVPDEHEKARQTVSQTVGRALAKIATELPGLRAHLDESLHLGLSCRYDPRPPESWDVSFS